MTPATPLSIDHQIALLKRGTTEIISEADLRKKLELGRPLRVKLGVDLTAKNEEIELDTQPNP